MEIGSPDTFIKGKFMCADCASQWRYFDGLCDGLAREATAFIKMKVKGNLNSGGDSKQHNYTTVL